MCLNANGERSELESEVKAYDRVRDSIGNATVSQSGTAQESGADS